MSQAELAALVGTTQPQIVRLETGQRRLTEDWMRKLAEALQVRPEELLSSAVRAGLEEDAKAYISTDQAISDRMLAARGLAHFQVISDVVEGAGIAAGKVLLIDMTTDAVAGVKTGDIVIAQVYSRRDLLQARTIVRQFVAPALLVTNRPRLNSAISLTDPDFDIAIKGVVVPD